MARQNRGAMSDRVAWHCSTQKPGRCACARAATLLLARLARLARLAMASRRQPAGSSERAAAAPLLPADRRAVWLAPGAVDCDVVAFEHSLAHGHVAQGLRMYQGKLLPGHFDTWGLAPIAWPTAATPMPRCG